MDTVDPLTLGVLASALTSAAEEMGWVLRRTSFSEAVREAEDLSASIFDADANMVGIANYAPGHLGTSPIAVAAVLRRYPKGTMRPGDAFILNDPSMNSGHLPDIFSIAPVFIGDEIIGFTVVTAHHVDVGGAAPGSQAVVGVIDIHQEGIRIPPVRYFRGGEVEREVLDLIAANVRIPDQVVGDLKGQYNANLVGARRLVEIVRRFGSEVFRTGVRQLLDGSEAAMRQAIARVPDGAYQFVDFLDDYGPGTERIRVQVEVRVRGDRLVVDFSGSSPATRSGVNTYLPFTVAYTNQGIQSLLAPAVLISSGSMRAVEVIAPEGSFFNPPYPTACGGRSLASRMIVDCINGAMSQALPDLAPAAASQLCNSTFGGIDGRNERPFVYYDLTTGSTGARPDRDGGDGLASGVNIANVPVEVHEASQPILVEQFGYVRDSGGAGRYRGGLSVQRDVRNLARLARLTNLHDRHELEPWGLHGGQPGAAGEIVLNPGRKNAEPLHSKDIRDLSKGDTVRFKTCGGGGWGDPLERDPKAVLEDVLEGYVSVQHALTRYGTVLTADARNLDLGATEALRLKMGRRDEP